MHRKLGLAVTSFVVVGVLVGTAASARAQRAPDMATLDRGDGISKIGIDVGVSLLDAPPYSSALRVELYGQYVLQSGLGFYGAFPIARSFGGADAPQVPQPPQDATALGNLDVGMLYVIDSSPTVSGVFRGGIALPFADDDRDGVLTNFSATWPRLTDLALTVPNATYLRLAVSPLIHIDKLFMRADIGVDLGSDDDGLADELVRLNIGGGVDLGIVALSLELVNTASVDEFDQGESFVHALTFTARFMGKALQPFVAIGAPLDDNIRSSVDLFIAAGIQIVP